jgi:hypothetical protein
MTSVAAVAPAQVVATWLSYLHHSLRRLADGPRPPTPEGSQPACAWGDVATPIRPITGRPSLSPSSFTRCPVGSPRGSLSPPPLVYGAGRTTGLPRSADVPEWPGRISKSVAHHLRRRSSGFPDLATYRSGPSGSAARACSCVTTPGMLYLGWPYHSILVPDRLAAGSRSYGSRLGCPPEGGGYVVPGLVIPVGYRWQNSGCCQSAPRSSAQLHRRPRVAPEQPSSPARPAR